MAKQNKIKPCSCCGVSTAKINEHFYLRLDVWHTVHASERGFLCIGCIEEKLGRKLTPADFTDCSINKPQRGQCMSARLANRLGL